jgi:excisionase family DNA binding protein
MPTTTNWITVKQAADRAGVSLALVYRWIGEGRLPHFRMGSRGTRGTVRIKPDDLDAFLETLRAPSPELPRRKATSPVGGFVHLDAKRLARAQAD